MNKEVKKHIIACLLFLITIIFFYFFLTKNQYYFASTTDFEAQHYLFPEYFRLLFYQTKDLFPDFAFHLGSGQNIFYFSYYGLLNPIILLSYLFPMIKMIDYIIFTNLLGVLISTILFYSYLRKKKYSFKTSFVVSYLFLCSGPLLFHAHRHVMFMNYMPFLILGLYGIDQVIQKKKNWLFIISSTLMIFTSYYYSVGGLICLFIYGIYQYLKEKKSVSKKEKIHDIFFYLITFILPIMISAVLLLPTLYTLLNGRVSTGSTLSYLKLLKPSLYLLYSPYSMGLTVVTLISLILSVFSKKKENRYLSIFLLFINIFPIFNYLLNGTIYINAKTLIPFIPLVLILTAEVLNSYFIKKTSWHQSIVIIYLLVSAFCICLKTNLGDTLILKEDLNNDLFNHYSDLVQEIVEKDSSEVFRINNSVLNKTSINKVSNIREYKTTLYSSTFQKEYQTFYNDIFNNPLPYRNKFMLNSSNNLLFQMFINEKYVLTKEELGLDYELIKEVQGIKVYKNNNTLPLGYATNNIITNETFSNLNYPSNALSLLKNIVVESGDTEKQNIVSIKPIDMDYVVKEKNNLAIEQIDENYYIKADKNATLTLSLQEDMTNKILFIRFKNKTNASCGSTEQEITINQVKNKLTCESWKYHNQNFIFDYVLLEPEELDISFAKGEYQLTDIEIYLLDYNKIKNIRENIDPFEMDQNTPVTDQLKGTIEVHENGYFTISIPYDKGFRIYMDGEEISYQKVNYSFIGFPITKGKHDIIIEYHAPYKNLGLLISGIGVLIFIIMIIYQGGRKKWKNYQ